MLSIVLRGVVIEIDISSDLKTSRRSPWQVDYFGDPPEDAFRKINSSILSNAKETDIEAGQNETSSISGPRREKEKKTRADLNNCRIFCESNLCIFSCLEQMYTKQWWPPLSFSMGLGWCAPLLSGNGCSSISNISENARNSIVCRHWETCNLRVTWPAGSHRRCPAEHASCQSRNASRYTLMCAPPPPPLLVYVCVSACVCERLCMSVRDEEEGEEEEEARVKCVASTISWPHSSCWL